MEISKTVGLIAKLRHCVPLHTLLSVDQSLISPYITDYLPWVRPISLT